MSSLSFVEFEFEPEPEPIYGRRHSDEIQIDVAVAPETAGFVMSQEGGGHES